MPRNGENRVFHRIAENLLVLPSFSSTPKVFEVGGDRPLLFAKPEITHWCNRESVLLVLFDQCSCVLAAIVERASICASVFGATGWGAHSILSTPFVSTAPLPTQITR